MKIHKFITENKILCSALLNLSFVNASLEKISQDRLITQHMEARVNLAIVVGEWDLILFNSNSIC